MRFRCPLCGKKDKKYFKNTANRVHKKQVIIGQRGGTRI